MSAPSYNYRNPNYFEFDEFRNKYSKWRGIWIIKSFQSWYLGGIITRRQYECSICTSKFEGDSLFPTNYCPNCGADMRNETEDFGEPGVVEDREEVN